MQENKYSVKVNDRYDHQIQAEMLDRLDIIPNSDGGFHLIRDGRSYQATVIAINKQEKSVLLQIGSTQFSVDIKDSYDALIDQLGLSLTVSHLVNEIKAPMPGLVLSVDVEEGQSVQQGDPLLVLEAMKMENVIKSPGDGVVKSVRAKKGKPVDKGEVLIELE